MAEDTVHEASAQEVGFDPLGNSQGLSRGDVIDYVKRLCKHDAIDAPQKPYLLRYLIWLKIRPTPGEDGDAIPSFRVWEDEEGFLKMPVPEQKGWAESASGESILWQFYQWAKSRGIRVPSNIATPADTYEVGRTLASTLRKSLEAYYAGAGKHDGIVISIPDRKAYQPRIARTRHPLVAPSSAPTKGLPGPFHLYHLTKSKHGRLMWSYTLLEVEDPITEEEPQIAKARDLTENDVVQSYEYKALLLGMSLVIRVRSRDALADVGIHMFPRVGSHGYPWSGTMSIAETYMNKPASSISICDRKALPEVAHVKPGEAITDPTLVRTLIDTWKVAANGVELERLPPVSPRTYSVWQDEAYDRLLEEIMPVLPNETDRPENPDLRIATTFFHGTDFGFDRLLRKGCRIHLILMDPTKREMIEGRFRLCADFDVKDPLTGELKRYAKDNACEILEEQLEALEQRPTKVGDQNRQRRGDLVVKISDIMPSGFLALSRTRGLLATMLAHQPYDRGGPVVEMTSEDTELWDLLNEEWRIRWADATLYLGKTGPTL